MPVGYGLGSNAVRGRMNYGADVGSMSGIFPGRGFSWPGRGAAGMLPSPSPPSQPAAPQPVKADLGGMQQALANVNVQTPKLARDHSEAPVRGENCDFGLGSTVKQACGGVVHLDLGGFAPGLGRVASTENQSAGPQTPLYKVGSGGDGPAAGHFQACKSAKPISQGCGRVSAEKYGSEKALSPAYGFCLKTAAVAARCVEKLAAVDVSTPRGPTHWVGASVGRVKGLPMAAIAGQERMLSMLGDSDKPEMRDTINQMAKTYPRELSGTAVRLGGSDTLDDIRRIWSSKTSYNPLYKLLGTAQTPIINLTSSVGRGSFYNPFSDTATIYGGLPAHVAHELGHAVDMNRKRGLMRDLYTLGRGPESAYFGAGPLTHWQEINASRHALQASGKDKEKGKAEMWRRLAPAWGTYAAATGMAGLGVHHQMSGGGRNTPFSKITGKLDQIAESLSRGNPTARQLLTPLVYTLGIGGTGALAGRGIAEIRNLAARFMKKDKGKAGNGRERKEKEGNGREERRKAAFDEQTAVKPLNGSLNQKTSLELRSMDPIERYLLKRAKQDNDAPQRSATGESKGLSFQHRDDDYAKGEAAWAATSKYFKGGSKLDKEPNPFEGKHRGTEKEAGVANVARTAIRIHGLANPIRAASTMARIGQADVNRREFLKLLGLEVGGLAADPNMRRAAAFGQRYAPAAVVNGATTATSPALVPLLAQSSFYNRIPKKVKLGLATAGVGGGASMGYDVLSRLLHKESAAELNEGST